jgi:uncharacterized protein (DUF2141 family)
MKRYPQLLLLSILGLALSTAAVAQEEAKTVVRAEIHGLKSTKGKLYCSIYAKAEGWPAKSALQNQTLVIRGKDAVCTFEGLKGGTYAVSVLHDENGNGEMDYGAFGAPAEGWASSNNVTHTFSGPDFQESSFALKAGETKVLSLEVHN